MPLNLDNEGRMLCINKNYNHQRNWFKQALLQRKLD